MITTTATTTTTTIIIIIIIIIIIVIIKIIIIIIIVIIVATSAALIRSEYMSRIPRHVSSRVYVSHSETCKQPSVDLVHISECEIHGGP